jgi:hypothetical protein
MTSNEYAKYENTVCRMVGIFDVNENRVFYFDERDKPEESVAPKFKYDPIVSCKTVEGWIRRDYKQQDADLIIRYFETKPPGESFAYWFNNKQSFDNLLLELKTKQIKI